LTNRLTYLDYNATAPAKPQVAEVVARILLEGGNPSSIHGKGRAARGLVETARDQVAALVGAPAKGVTFTGSGTEANNLVFAGAVTANKVERLIVSATDHESIAAPAEAADIEVVILGCDQDGTIDAETLSECLAKSNKKTLVSIMLANNETGRIQDIAGLAKVAHEAGAIAHCDAVQAAGKIEVDFASLDVDLMSLASHKFAGPQGVGALIRKPSVDVKAQLLGGGQELGRRSGTENLAGIVGFGIAADLAKSGLSKMGDLKAWRDALEQKIKAAAPEAVIICENVERLPNTSLIALPGIGAETQVMSLDLAGFCVSSGSACSSGKVSASGALKAMGFGSDIAGSAVRVSLGWKSEAAELEEFFKAWAKMRERLSRSSVTTASQVA
jgi:cysteine desulfurase